MDGVKNPVIPGDPFQFRLIQGIRLILGKIHIKLNKLQFQFLAQGGAVFHIRQFNQCRHSVIHSIFSSSPALYAHIQAQFLHHREGLPLKSKQTNLL